jgi:hypothetical protein
MKSSGFKFAALALAAGLATVSLSAAPAIAAQRFIGHGGGHFGGGHFGGGGHWGRGGHWGEGGHFGGGFRGGRGGYYGGSYGYRGGYGGYGYGGGPYYGGYGLFGALDPFYQDCTTYVPVRGPNGRVIGHRFEDAC